MLKRPGCISILWTEVLLKWPTGDEKYVNISKEIIFQAYFTSSYHEIIHI